MKTSNFANNQIHQLKGISISRFPDKRNGYIPEFTPLIPSEQLLKAYKAGLPWAEYATVYQMQLDCLKPEKVLDRLQEISAALGASEPILLCWESAKTLDSQPCHRRLVAKWFQASLGIEVPEWTKTEPQGSLFS